MREVTGNFVLDLKLNGYDPPGELSGQDCSRSLLVKAILGSVSESHVIKVVHLFYRERQRPSH